VKYMLDTNILIYLLKKKPPSVAERIDSLDEADELCMSFVTYAELLKGAQRSARKDEALRRIEGLCFLIAVLYPTGPAICLRYAEQSVRLRAAGHPIGGNDLWIAAHALADDAMLVTNNVGEFSRIEGLRVENWVA